MTALYDVWMDGRYLGRMAERWGDRARSHGERLTFRLVTAKTDRTYVYRLVGLEDM